VYGSRYLVADYRRLNAYQTPWKRLVEFYDTNGEDRTSFIYIFPRDRMGIEIIVHRRVPLAQFRRLLRQFYQVKAREDMVRTDEIEIRVTRRPESYVHGLTTDSQDENVVEEDE
jgi:hypothetical protein